MTSPLHTDLQLHGDCADDGILFVQQIIGQDRVILAPGERGGEDFGDLKGGIIGGCERDNRVLWSFKMSGQGLTRNHYIFAQSRSLWYPYHKFGFLPWYYEVWGI